MKTLLRTLALCATAIAAANAQNTPKIRPLGPIVASSTDTLAPSAVRALPGGKLLVNDPMRRRLVLLDSTLARVAVVADTTSATANAYPAVRPAGLLPFKGDSALFIDPASLSMFVIDPSGKLGRVMSVPRSQDAGFLIGIAGGSPGFDAQGRLVYRGNNFVFPSAPPQPGQPFTMPEQPDSAPIVRIDLATRKLDTVAFVKTPKIKMNVQRDEATGRINMQSEVNPLPVVDDWAMLPDGSLAVVRGRDYHVDFVNPDGTRISAAKVPFEWQRLSDEDKVAFIDSVKAARERLLASGNTAAANGALLAGAGLGGAQVVIGGAGGGPGGGGATQQVFVGGGPGGPGGAGGQGNGARRDRPRPDAGGEAGVAAKAAGVAASGGASTDPKGQQPPRQQGPQVNFIPPNELPDYKPAFFGGAVRADREGNLWIRTIPTKAIPGGAIYDVINRKGELVDRVQIPAGRQIVGFGPGGTVYLALRDESGVARMERAKVR